LMYRFPIDVSRVVKTPGAETMRGGVVLIATRKQMGLSPVAGAD